MTTETCKCPVCHASATLSEDGFQCGDCKMALPMDYYNRLLDRFFDTARPGAMVANQWRMARKMQQGNTVYLVNGWQSQYSHWHGDYRAAIDEAIEIIK